MTHGDLVNACLLALTEEGVLAWDNQTGAAKIQDRFIHFGLKGSSDILGCLPPTGRLIGVECKVGRDRQRDRQKGFQKAVERCGGLYLLVRDVPSLRFLIRQERDRVAATNAVVSQ